VWNPALVSAFERSPRWGVGLVLSATQAHGSLDTAGTHRDTSRAGNPSTAEHDHAVDSCRAGPWFGTRTLNPLPAMASLTILHTKEGHQQVAAWLKERRQRFWDAQNLLECNRH